MKSTLRLPAILRMALRLYDGIWRAVMPGLRHHPRLREGYRQRILHTPLPRADVWIQSASVGESYLTWELVKRLNPSRPIRVLATANTRQGVELLEKASEAIRHENPSLHMEVRYFPFDRPGLMTEALSRVRPRLMVFLETELWPGLLGALKAHRIPSLVVNGRISARSFRRYSVWSTPWRHLGPDRILAVSEADAGRFRSLFSRAEVGVMNNIKFDRLDIGSSSPEKFREGVAEFIPPEVPFLVLGSIRQEEESQVEKLILLLRSRHSDTVFGLFPRHFQRIPFWKERLRHHAIPWVLRSEIRSPLAPGGVVLWDTFGELVSAYSLADAVFIGGSLAPLGGQNFLEPLAYGIRPVIGSSRENFQWVGIEMFDADLVRVGSDWRTVAELLSKDLTEGFSRRDIRDRAGRYLRSRKGGTRQACRVMESILNG